jgi:hypothetical protein
MEDAQKRTTFNQPIGNWNVQKVKTFLGMFQHNHEFDQHLDGWVTSAAEDMSYMFSKAIKFNGRVPFDTSKVQTMDLMFQGFE